MDYITCECENLSGILKGLGVNRTPESLRSSCEAYGEEVFCYLRVDDMATRSKLQAELTAEGIQISPEYWPGQPVLEIRVSYFRAWHWDE